MADVDGRLVLPSPTFWLPGGCGFCAVPPFGFFFSLFFPLIWTGLSYSSRRLPGFM